MNRVRLDGLIFLACAIPRLLYLLTFGLAERPEGALYWGMADSILRDGTLGFNGYPSTMQDPLYPMCLAVGRWLTGDRYPLVAMLQIAICGVGGIYLYKLARELSTSRTVASIAVLLYAGSPYHIRQSVAMIEVSLVMCLLIMVAYYYCRASRWNLMGGLAFGLMMLSRAATLPIWCLAVIALLLRRHVRHAVVLMAVPVLVVLPFSLRNALIDGSWLPTRGGLNFLNHVSNGDLPRR